MVGGYGGCIVDGYRGYVLCNSWSVFYPSGMKIEKLMILS